MSSSKKTTKTKVVFKELSCSAARYCEITVKLLGLSLSDTKTGKKVLAAYLVDENGDCIRAEAWQEAAKIWKERLIENEGKIFCLYIAYICQSSCRD